VSPPSSRWQPAPAALAEPANGSWDEALDAAQEEFARLHPHNPSGEPDA
jgi:hypothetical protein